MHHLRIGARKVVSSDATARLQGVKIDVFWLENEPKLQRIACFLRFFAPGLNLGLKFSMLAPVDRPNDSRLQKWLEMPRSPE
jgi:hypothetical protein